MHIYIRLNFNLESPINLIYELKLHHFNFHVLKDTFLNRRLKYAHVFFCNNILNENLKKYIGRLHHLHRHNHQRSNTTFNSNTLNNSNTIWRRIVDSCQYSFYLCRRLASCQSDSSHQRIDNILASNIQVG